MRILVCIASYGSRNDVYLAQLLQEYGRMPYDVDVVVVSNIEKPLPPGVELRVGTPTKNPWSLPFAHRAVFEERKDQYDLFIYSEDDTLITRSHVDAFMRAAAILKDDELAGFLRSEEGPDGTMYFSTIHRHYHWDPKSVVVRGGETFAFFTNEHGACYILTREQLRKAIASGGYSVPPHEGKYDMLVSAATDPYTQCGFRKLICISKLEEFTCKHLTNKYVGRTGLESDIVQVQIQALLDIGRGAKNAGEPTPVETLLPGTRWAKSYYEPRRDDLVGLIPSTASSALSVGCGWGAFEEVLVERGIEVTAVPLDVVIGAVAERRGVRVLDTSIARGHDLVPAASFDVLMILGLLHLTSDPVDLLRQYSAALKPTGVLLITVPNVMHLAVRLRRLVGDTGLAGLGDFRRSGVHVVSPGQVVAWLEASGLRAVWTGERLSDRWGRLNRFTMGLLKGFLAEELIVVAQPG